MGCRQWSLVTSHRRPPKYRRREMLQYRDRLETLLALVLTLLALLALLAAWPRRADQPQRLAASFAPKLGARPRSMSMKSLRSTLRRPLWSLSNRRIRDPMGSMESMFRTQRKLPHQIRWTQARRWARENSQPHTPRRWPSTPPATTSHDRVEFEVRPAWSLVTHSVVVEPHRIHNVIQHVDEQDGVKASKHRWVERLHIADSIVDRRTERINRQLDSVSAACEQG